MAANSTLNVVYASALDGNRYITPAGAHHGDNTLRRLSAPGHIIFETALVERIECQFKDIFVPRSTTENTIMPRGLQHVLRDTSLYVHWHQLRGTTFHLNCKLQCNSR